VHSRGIGAAAGTGAVSVGQMVCVEFTTRAGRPIRLFGCLAESTDDHLLIDALDGSSTRPGIGESVVVSTLIGRAVQHSSTTVLAGGDLGGRRMMVRHPVAFLEGNRRRHDRVVLKLPVTFFEIERGPSTFATGVTIDISISGLLFGTTSASVAAGERIVLLVELPGRTVAGICEVRSMRDDKGTFRVGIEWVALPDLDRAALAALGA
jgi:hypothetical protein